MTRTSYVLMALGVAALAACEDNPVLQPDVHDEDLEVAVSFSDEHLATLSEMEVEVAITDHDGVPVTDFELVAAEMKLEDEDEWVPLELTLHDGHFSAPHMFYSSGEYNLRVVAQRHGADHAETIYTRNEQLEVERIHMDVGPYRVEMETFPGHVHEGDDAEVKFWVLREGGGGPMMGMGGLAATIQLHHEASGVTAEHMADEHESGVYEAHHTFTEHGETEVGIGFDDGTGGHHEALFHVPVSENH